MSYIKSSLSKDEEIYQIFKHHWIVKLYIMLHFIVAAISLGIWLIPAIIVWFGWRETEQGVTNKRIISKQGIISRTTAEMRLNALESIFIKQSILGRLLGYVTITVTGRGQEDIKLAWMIDPLRVKREIESIEYGQKREPIEDHVDTMPNAMIRHEYFFSIKNLLIMSGIVVLIAGTVLSIGGSKDKVTTVKDEPPENINLSKQANVPIAEPEEQKTQAPEHNVVANENQQPISIEETKEPADKSTVWVGNWGNDIVAIVNTEPCSDHDYVKDGYTFLITSSIPVAKLKKPADAYFVSGGRATTVIGCWFKKEGGLIHVKMKRKHDGKVWETDNNLEDSAVWTPQAESVSSDQPLYILDEANKRINIVWNGASKEVRAALLPEQKEWLKKREDDCNLKATTEQPDNPGAQEPIRTSCMATMTNERTETLKQKIAAMETQ